MTLFLCKTADVDADEPKQVTLADGRILAVYRLDDGFYATDDVCTHGEASLAEGEIEGHEIICPFHLGAFDIRTGEPTRAPCTASLKVYPVVCENGEVMLAE
ncbi:non-heme iron oxygenase ferredoxin subunit [Parasphingopyxis algicola]|uniref:non-heme iron oxygenase ferredoxin subunit n=1 Tax=Parasphingopyxis algicola TaxID=2026624 RepID=UPI0015A322BC|nr:non-heme iron oxygenase ferredoxin subunit [Parasphingopyxis algicola]QLC25062.1 non-heme iron oxygenase ferredoxin subunit [Parasphingopyxis algicola]